MLRILIIVCISLLVVSCSKKTQEQAQVEIPQDIVNVSAPGQESHKEISLGGTGGISHEVEFIGEKGKSENIDIAVPKGFSLKTVIVPGGSNTKKTFTPSQKQTETKNVIQGIASNPVNTQSNTLTNDTSSPTQTTGNNPTQAGTLGINDNSLSNSIADINTPSDNSQISVPVVPKEKTFFAKVLDFIPGFGESTTSSETRVANNGIQTPTNSQETSSQSPGTDTQNQGNTENQSSGNQGDTSSGTGTNQASQEQTNTGTQDGNNVASGDQGGTGNETSTGTEQSTDAGTSEPETQIITEEIVDSNLPDLSNYPITSQSGSIYIFTDDARGMGIIISLHNRGSYGTAEELIDPTLVELGGLSREDLAPGTITNTHNYPKFDVRGVIDTPEESKIYYLRFYDFGKILVYIGAYTIPEKLEQNESLMKSIIDTFLWNEEF